MELSRGQLIKKERKELGLTQVDFAKIVGLHGSDISDFERGKRGVTGKIFNRITSAIAEYKEGLEPHIEQQVIQHVEPHVEQEQQPFNVQAFASSIEAVFKELVELRQFKVEYEHYRKQYEQLKSDYDMMLGIINRARKDILVPDQDKPKFVYSKESNSLERVL